jgi:hypothetical protein
METDMEQAGVIAEDVVREILDLEWDMFSRVQSLDGPVACQQDPRAFEIMRSSQILSWSQEVALSYLSDLKQAVADGRNLMTEKYARMMEYTAPCEFRCLGPDLPALDKEADLLLGKLSRLSVGWMEALVAKYPHVGAQGRPLHSSEDGRFTTSFETYNRGELSTYSTKTLQLLLDHYLAMAATGTNPAEVILRHTVEKQGFASLERAEAVQEARAGRRG